MVYMVEMSPKFDKICVNPELSAFAARNYCAKLVAFIPFLVWFEQEGSFLCALTLT